MIRVLIADDQGMVRTGFTAFLGGQPDIEVVGEAATARIQRTAELAPRRRPHGRAHAGHGRAGGDAGDPARWA